MNDNRQIEPVHNNYEKYLAYKTQIARYKKAVSNEFYFEAILIDYAMMEDRLISIFYHIGVIDNRNVSVKVTKRTGKYLELILDKRPPKSLSTIGSKIELLQAILKWVESDTPIEPDQKYLILLRNHCRQQVDIPDFLNKLDEINNWRKYRNEIIHSLLNKNSSAVNEKLEEKAIEGKDLARFIDDQSAKIRKGNVLRRCLKLKVEK